MSTSLQFWKPGTLGPGSSLDRISGEEGGLLASAIPLQAQSIQAQRDRLPIAKHKDNLVYCVENHQVVIVVGQTGCGKTTQIPQYLHETGWSTGGRVIACTQPRRVAVTSVAARTAYEMGSVAGEEVGYTIRFEDVSTKELTRICYMTDGVLFREALLDPLLSRFSVIMVDEAHERSVYTDLLLAILKKVCRKRPSLRIIVSSATLDATAFLEFFSSLPDPIDSIIVSLEGRAYPVQMAYLEEPTEDYVRKAVETVISIHGQHGKGDILVFLTGREEIDRCLEELVDGISSLPEKRLKLRPMALHSGLTMAEQMEVFEPSPSDSRKVVVATNIAEVRMYDGSVGLSSLKVVPISQASAIQRAGRAGRTSEGLCYRLYTFSDYNELPSVTMPEITRTELSSAILQLKALGIDNFMKLQWLTIPPSESIAQSLSSLIIHSVIDNDGRLTSLGTKVAEIPLDVKAACVLLDSQKFRCGEEILTIIAMTAIQDVFIIPAGAAGATAELERRKFTAEEGDHLTLLNAYNAFVGHGQSSSWCKSHALSFRALSRAVSIRSQLKKYMKRFDVQIESCQGDAKRLRQCLVNGYKQNGARWIADGTYRSIRGNTVLHVHPNSTLFTRKPSSGWVIFHDIEETKKIQMSIITEVEPEWLLTQENEPHAS
ncbi:P-loop containing nucleoside triphosphate hydrolase protein [Russula ochroleuca]|uniref:RNA helicase n=1 Tax=Russula ochroleuca TaxID=152965 RepID=A0A9P5MV03_9AGAM|nr:P-loop containing nucleoside triphosphate hydrolase protein [Russula ochroleuca]